MQISMTPGMYHNSGPFPVVFGVKMRLESCFGCNSFSAYRAAPFLVVPDFNENDVQVVIDPKREV